MAMASAMDTAPPVGVLLCAVFWILVGTDVLLLFSTSGSASVFGSIYLLFGLFFVLIGWGLLQLQNWARISGMVFSVLGILYSIPGFLTMMEDIWYGFSLSYALLRLGLPFLLIIMIWYFVRQKSLFRRNQPLENPV